MYGGKHVGVGSGALAGSGGLAATGTAVGFYLALALGLIVVGLLLLRAAMFRRPPLERRR